MQIISTIQYWMILILAMIIVITGIVGALLFYLLKIKKVSSKESHIDYTYFNKKDSKELVKFDDIISGSMLGKNGNNDGVIVTNNGTTFTAAIKVNGFNFYAASAEEQKSCMVGMLGFLSSIEHPIQFRQSTKSIDLSHTIETNERKITELTKEIITLDLDYKTLLTQSEDYLDEPDTFDVFDKQMEIIRKKITTKDWMKRELECQNEWMKKISDGSMESEKIATYIFSWSYNPLEYSHELTKEQIYLKAISELSIRENTYAAALSRCKCRVERLSATELMEQFHRHNAPISADNISVEQILDSSYNTLFVTCDSLVELEKERLGDEAYYRMLSDIEEQNQDNIERVERTISFEEDNIENMLQQALQDFNPALDITSENMFEGIMG